MATAIQQEIKTHSPKGYSIFDHSQLADSKLYQDANAVFIRQSNYKISKEIVRHVYINRGLEFLFECTVAIFRVKPKNNFIKH